MFLHQISGLCLWTYVITSIPPRSTRIPPSLHPPLVNSLHNELVCLIHSSQLSLASPVFLCLQRYLSTLEPLLQDNHIYSFIPLQHHYLTVVGKGVFSESQKSHKDSLHPDGELSVWVSSQFFTSTSMNSDQALPLLGIFPKDSMSYYREFAHSHPLLS